VGTKGGRIYHRSVLHLALYSGKPVSTSVWTTSERCFLEKQGSPFTTHPVTSMSSVSTYQTGDVVVISLEGEFDVADAEELRTNAQHALDAAGVTHIVVDLAQVTFMGSTALGALVGLRAEAAHASIGLALSNVPARVRRLLALTQLDTIFDVVFDVAGRAGAGEPLDR
jgi:anti-anti-sigma factor